MASPAMARKQKPGPAGVVRLEDVITPALTTVRVALEDVGVRATELALGEAGRQTRTESVRLSAVVSEDPALPGLGRGVDVVAFLSTTGDVLDAAGHPAGHDAAAWADPTFLAHVAGGLRWAAG